MPIVIIAVIVLLFLMALILYRLRVGGPIPPLFASAAPKVSTPTPAFYTDDLYGFTTRYPRAIGLNLAAYTADPECKGVVFVDESDTQKPTSSAYPRFKICFVAFDTALPAGDIGGQLEARSDQVERNFLSLPERGLMPRHRSRPESLAGAGSLRPRPTAKRGRMSSCTRPSWSTSTGSMPIEAADLASNWDNTWPIFRDAIAALLFADRVVIPPDAPVVLP